MIVGRAIYTGRFTLQLSERDKITYYHDEQDKVRGHWGIASTVPPEAAAIQATPTSFVSVSKWTRTHTNKLLLDAGFGGIYYGWGNFERNPNPTHDLINVVEQCDERVTDNLAARVTRRFLDERDAFGQFVAREPLAEIRQRVGRIER